MPRRNLSDAQKDAGNYRKPKVRVHGMEISVENPKGSIRSGVDRSGKPWAIRMTCAYGYFLGTKAGDGDHLDVFLGPDRSSELVFVVNQVEPDTGKWDEHKICLGFRTLAEAKAAYLSNYSPGWKGLGSIIPVTLPKFKAWAFSGKKLRDPLPVDFRSLTMPTMFATPTPPRPVFKPKLPRTHPIANRLMKQGGLTREEAIAATSFLKPRTMSASINLTNLEARIGRLIDFATPTPRTNTQLLRTSRLNPLSMKKTGYGNEIMVAPKKLKGDAKSAAGYFADSSLPGRAGARDAIKEARSVTAGELLRQRRNNRGQLAAYGLASRRPTTDFSVDRSGGYVTIRDAQGNERKFRQPGLLNAIKRNPGKTAAAGTLAAGAAAYGLKRAFKK